MLIISCGVFEGIGTDVTTENLVRTAGLCRELAERVGIPIAIPAASPTVLVELYRERAEELRRRFQRFGFELETPSETLSLLARIVASEAGGAGSRSGAAWLEDAAQRRLMAMLDGGAAPGAKAVLGPDDIDGALRARAKSRGSQR
jgi:hypothetical protein